MKRRPVDTNEPADDLDALSDALCALESSADVRAFLLDLCTPSELEAMVDRWRVVPLLLQRIPYREIHSLTQVSVTTIGRVARTIDHGSGGYLAAIRRSHPALHPGDD